ELLFMTSTHQQEPSSHLSPLVSHRDAEMIHRIADLVQSHTGEQWEILQLTRYEEHWVALGYQGGLQRDFLFRQMSEQLVYCVAEKTIYPHSKSMWRYSTDTHEPLELVTYVVQYGGTQCNDYTVSTDFTKDALRDYLLDYEPGTDILVTCFYGERED